MTALGRRMSALALAVAILIHLSFYVSAHATGWYAVFFEHVTRGQDFFQIPNGAAAYLAGGTLTGHPPEGVARYTDCCGVNDNVYHPLLTLAVGVPLRMFPPWTAFYVWTLMHLLVTAVVVAVMYAAYRRSSRLVPAICLYLVNPYHYYEIEHAQFHFLLTAAFLVLIVYLEKRRDTVLGGIILALSLLVKPVGLLFVVPLMLAGYWRTAVVGLGLYAAWTVPLLWWTPGRYFIDNILAALTASSPSYNLMAIVRVLPGFPMTAVTVLKVLGAAGLVGFQIRTRPGITRMLMLWTIFQLVFYSGTYHYYYAVMGPVVAVSVATGMLRRTWLSLLAVALVTLPTPVVLFRLSGAPAILPQRMYSIVALYSVATVIIYAAALIGGTRRTARAAR